jgi:hypothetical protein
MTDAALKLALETLRNTQDYKQGRASVVEAAEDIEAALAKQDGQSNFCAQCEAFARELKVVKQALAAQPAQEPVSVTYKEVADAMNSLWNGTLEQHQIAQQMANKKLYTTPQQRPWVGLTDEDHMQFAISQFGWDELIEAVEAKLKEKNT